MMSGLCFHFFYSRGSHGGRAKSRGAAGVTFLPTDAAPRPQSENSNFAVIADAGLVAVSQPV